MTLPLLQWIAFLAVDLFQVSSWGINGLWDAGDPPDEFQASRPSGILGIQGLLQRPKVFRKFRFVSLKLQCMGAIRVAECLLYGFSVCEVKFIEFHVYDKVAEAKVLGALFSFGHTLQVV